MAKTEPQISPALLSNLFARFTADRDALLAAVERCERHVTELSRLVGAAPAAGAGATAGTKADEALATAKEALAMAREAMRMVAPARRA